MAFRDNVVLDDAQLSLISKLKGHGRWLIFVILIGAKAMGYNAIAAFGIGLATSLLIAVGTLAYLLGHTAKRAKAPVQEVGNDMGARIILAGVCSLPVLFLEVFSNLRPYAVIAVPAVALSARAIEFARGLRASDLEHYLGLKIINDILLGTTLFVAGYYVLVERQDAMLSGIQVTIWAACYVMLLRANNLYRVSFSL